MRDELHIEEAPLPVDEGAKQSEELIKALEEIGQIALFTGWLDKQSPTIQALAAEYAEIGARKGFVHSRINVTVEIKKGRTIWTCHALNGYHQSTTSAEHAVFLLVDSHRVRTEDSEEFRERVMAATGMTKREAFRRCARLTNEMRAANPKATGQQRDRLATLWLESLEAEVAKPQRKVTDFSPGDLNPSVWVRDEGWPGSKDK